MTGNGTVLPSSFRDPSGFVFVREGTIYRQVNPEYQRHYDLLMASGLYGELTKAGWLVTHDEVEPAEVGALSAYKVLMPEPVPFISYPYEWSFSQLKDAALLTLQVQKLSLQFGMWLKDSSAFNVQFSKGRPLLIDSLSFEAYEEGRPWVGYQQFCRHFVAPLALMCYRHPELAQWFRVHLDGIPLDLTSLLLPMRTRLRFPLLLHVHLHSRAQKRYAARTVDAEKKFGKMALCGLIGSLESAVRSLNWRPAPSVWLDYYRRADYSVQGIEEKKRFVAEVLDLCTPRPRQLWDLGANTGLYSRIASEKGIETIAFDRDTSAVEVNYLNCVKEKQSQLLPLVLDVTNPSPGLGWMHAERLSLGQRGPVDVVLALALVHHLALSNNLPLALIARFMAQTGRWLVIEFVPKSDRQAQRLLANRQDIFRDYGREAFEKEFGRYFTIRRSMQLADSQRVLYWMERFTPEDEAAAVKPGEARNTRARA
jgi:hypothetical protein